MKGTKTDNFEVPLFPLLTAFVTVELNCCGSK